jgi:hypothetical protein
MSRFRWLLADVPTGLGEIRHLSIGFIQLRFLPLIYSPPNIQLVKGGIISATKRRSARPIGIFRFCSGCSSRPVMEIKIMLPGNYL